MLTILHLLKYSDQLERDEEIEKTPRDSYIFLEIIHPFNKTLGYESAKQVDGPRILKTHLPLQYWKEQLDKNPELKIIQTIRNPRDTLVSAFHFYRTNMMLGGFHGNWDDFFEIVKADQMIFGNLFDHTANYYSYHKGRKNSLVLFYEDMKKNLRGNVKKIADFLGKDVSDRVIDIITKRTTFENMKKDEKLMPPLPKNLQMKLTTGRSEFMRKGKAGDWKEYFNKDQEEFIDRKCKEIMSPLGIEFTYE